MSAATVRDIDCTAAAEDSHVMEKSHIAIGSFEDEPDDVAYWLLHTPEERLAAMEHLRRQFFSYEEPRPELRRFLEIAELPRG
ncbi:MAG TPA: hypothetical protein VMM36_04840 [Opitutaceae bacterium]|nr:hypothetical protein [Opitutaceae bacterium]